MIIFEKINLLRKKHLVQPCIELDLLVLNMAVIFPNRAISLNIIMGLY